MDPETLLLIRNDCVRFSGYDQPHEHWKWGEASSDRVGHGIAQAPGALFVVSRLLYGGGGHHHRQHRVALDAVEMGFSAADAQWILNGYALGFGGLLLLLRGAGDMPKNGSPGGQGGDGGG